MTTLYTLCHQIGKKWLWAFLSLVVLTSGLGFAGYWEMHPEDSFEKIAYRTAQLFIIEGTLDADETPSIWYVFARWAGLFTAFFTVFSFGLRLFRDRCLRALVKTFAREHVIIAGLGPDEGYGESRQETGEKLVVLLRELGYPVVVLEPNPKHGGIDVCRDAGAIVLSGSAAERTEMEGVALNRATALLALFMPDRENVQTVCHAYDLFKQWEHADEFPREARPAQPLMENPEGKVRCVLQVSEPGMVEVLRNHVLYADDRDPLFVRILNVHEVTARAMLREATLIDDEPPIKLKLHQPRRILVLGTGAKGRLGETLIRRAARDWYVDRHGDVPEFDRLLIELYERDAEQWRDDFFTRHDDLRDICEIRAHECIPERIGVCGLSKTSRAGEPDVGAVFVCFASEEHALVQAKVLQAAFHGRRIPIVVRLLEGESGFGTLLTRMNIGGESPLIVPIGTEDRVADLLVASYRGADRKHDFNPEQEMLAQVLHQDFLHLNQQQLEKLVDDGEEAEAERRSVRESVQRWIDLPSGSSVRSSNHDLARRLKRLMTVRDAAGHTRVFQAYFYPDVLIHPRADYVLSDYDLTDEQIAAGEPRSEVDLLAEQEHEGWRESQRNMGVVYGKEWTETTNPNMVDWAVLDKAARDFDRNIVRRLPYVFAKADYRLIDVTVASASGTPRASEEREDSSV